MLTTYQSLLAHYNPAVPVDLQLPPNHGDTVTLSDATVAMTVTLAGDDVTEINITVADDAVEPGGSFYSLWVEGFEGGMGWESIRYYQAMMATLKDHATHTATNDQGITVRHSWSDGQVTLLVTAEK